MADLTGTTPADTYKSLLQIGDTTNGVDATAKYIEDGEGTDSALAISTDNVGIGTDSPSAKLSTKVASGGAYFIDVAGTSSKQWGLFYQQDSWLSSKFSIDEFNNTGTASPRLTIGGGGYVGIGTDSPAVELDVVGDIQYTGTITDVSDRRKKENIEELKDSLSKICQLSGKSYDMVNDERIELGFIAQEVQQVFPEIVKVVETVEEEGQEPVEYLGVSYIQLVAPLVEAVKQQQSIIEDLKARVEVLEQ